MASLVNDDKKDTILKHGSILAQRTMERINLSRVKSLDKYAMIYSLFVFFYIKLALYSP